MNDTKTFFVDFFYLRTKDAEAQIYDSSGKRWVASFKHGKLEGSPPQHVIKAITRHIETGDTSRRTLRIPYH